MKNTFNDNIVSLISDNSSSKLVRVNNIIKNLNKKIQVFDNAVKVMNEYQDSEKFFDLTKKSMKSFSDKKKAIKEKVQKLGDSLTKVQAYGMNIASNIKMVDQNSHMCDVDYYRKLAEKYGLETNTLMEIKKMASSIYLFNARMAKYGIALETLDKFILKTCFVGGAVHSFHQQECNHGEWLHYLNCSENRKLFNACGYKVPQEYEE